MSKSVPQREAANDQPFTGELLSRMFDNIHVLLAHLDRDFNFVRVNQAYADAGGRPPEAYIGRNHFDLYPDAENASIFRRVMETGEPYHAHARAFEHPDQPDRGTTYWDWSVFPILEPEGTIAGLVFMLRDATERQRAEMMHDRLSAIIEATPDFVGIADADGHFSYLNRAGRAMIGIGQDDHLAGLSVADVVPPRVWEVIVREGFPAMRDHGVWQHEAALRRRDGSEIPVSQIAIAHRDEAGEIAFYSTIARDISARIRAETRLARVNRTYAVLTTCDEHLIRAKDEETLYHAFCDNLVRVGAYRFVWVGMIEGEVQVRTRPVAWAGHEAGYLDAVREARRLGDTEPCPAGTAVRSGRAVVVRNIRNDEGAWAVEALRRGHHSVIAFPLRSNDRTLGVLTIYSAEKDAFDDEEVELLAGLANDLAYGIYSVRAERARAAAEGLLRLRNRAIELSPNAIGIVDAHDPVCPLVYVNPAFESITGYSADEALGRNPTFLLAEAMDEDQPALEIVHSLLRQHREGSVVLHGRRRDGSLFCGELHVSPVRDELSGEVTHFVGALDDVTEQRRYQEQLEYQAQHDEQTGLPNRNLLNDRLTQALAYARRYDRTTAVLFLNLDQFKLINESLGHGAGDEVLRKLADRFKACARQGDTVARYGGDEFVVVLSDIEQLEDVSLAAERFLNALSDPVAVSGHQMRLTASIGAALFPRDGDEPTTLLRNADTAMHLGKERGVSGVHFFRAEMNVHAMERLTLRNHLRSAIENGELVLHYQPQVDLATGMLVGMEALVRWNHPDLGLISPGRFIPIAEESGLIVALGQWALRTACAQAYAWQEEGLPGIAMAVNVSPRQLRDDTLAETVASVLDETGLDPRCLELELTESSVMEEPERMFGLLQSIKDLGVQLALDDFGTGYSSLAHLHRFPFDKLKIDMSFVRDITTDPHSASIARTIIGMGHGLGMRVLAEGVETEEQLVYLRRHGCEEMQGFFMSKPLPAEQVRVHFGGGPRIPLEGGGPEAGGITESARAQSRVPGG